MNTVVVLSGGQDSTTCLFWALERYGQDGLMAVSFRYEQRHRIELSAARRVAHVAQVPHEVVNLGPVLGGSSPLVNPDVEVERYASADALPGGLERTFVAGRNILFLTLAAARGYVDDNTTIRLVLGVSQEDYGGYPDCRATFIDAMELALSLGLDAPVDIQTPLVDLDKAETVRLAQSLPGCMEALAYSHTCYNGAVPPCGQCHACLLRARGFAQVGVEDPLLKRLREAA